MERRRDMRKHVTFVAALHIGFGVLSLIGALIVFFVFGFARSQVGSDEVALMVLGILKMLVPVLVGGFGLLGILGGIGLLGYKAWARILVIVLSALSCLNVPIGTAKGVYSLWALLQDDTMDLFDGGNGANVTSEEIVDASAPE
ncbi:MAG: hypothetical protein ABR519_00675 [Bacteroidales bacterium]